MEPPYLSGTVRADSRLIGIPCSRCRWTFTEGQVVEIVTDVGLYVPVHVACPRSAPPEQPPLKKAARRRAWDALSKADPLALSGPEREAYEEGRW